MVRGEVYSRFGMVQKRGSLGDNRSITVQYKGSWEELQSLIKEGDGGEMKRTVCDDEGNALNKNK